MVSGAMGGKRDVVVGGDSGAVKGTRNSGVRGRAILRLRHH